MASGGLSVPHCRLWSAPDPLGPRLLACSVGTGRPWRVVWSRDTLACVPCSLGQPGADARRIPHLDSYQGYAGGCRPPRRACLRAALGLAGWDIPDGGLGVRPRIVL